MVCHLIRLQAEAQRFWLGAAEFLCGCPKSIQNGATSGCCCFKSVLSLAVYGSCLGSSIKLGRLALSLSTPPNPIESLFKRVAIRMSGKGGSSNKDEDMELRRGPWTLEEDTLLTHYVACHGEGRWNLLARCSGNAPSDLAIRLALARLR